MTFERIFTDPKGDLVRVQEALARPECQLAEAESNWQLDETCHAAAFHSTALVMYFCYYEGHRGGDGAPRSPAPQNSPERDHAMWIHSLKYRWVKEKSESLDPKSDPLSPMYTELYKQIAQLIDDNEEAKYYPDWVLIWLVARLGDEAAGLTRIGSSEGRFAGWFNHSWNDLGNLFTKHPPSVKRACVSDEQEAKFSVV
ncbi:MAG: hypothetical protein OXH84_06875 [Gammaproteobacteria bacterium]|nr:hypothetical protein [Gammaproteobacteria bacterium]